jgi:hypothetical protein
VLARPTLDAVLRGVGRMRFFARASDGDISLAALRSPPTVRLAADQSVQDLAFAGR